MVTPQTTKRNPTILDTNYNPENSADCDKSDHQEATKRNHTIFDTNNNPENSADGDTSDHQERPHDLEHQLQS